MTASLAPSETLCAVVVTYNRLEQLKVTVARLLEAAPEHLAHLVVVDNASTDGTAEWLAGVDDPRLEVLTSAVNDGGAGGFHRGLAHARGAFDPDWYVIMDDDGRPEPGALAVFHGADKRGWDAVAAAVYLPGGLEICDMNRPCFNPFWSWPAFRRTLRKGRRGFHLAAPDYRAADAPGGGVMAVDVSSFVGLFIARSGLERAGLPDGSLFVYGDDGLYTLGLSAAGGKIAFMPRIRFEHDCQTLEAGSGRFQPLWKAYYYHRNLLMLYRAAAGVWFWPALALILPKWLLKARAHGGQRLAFVRLLLRAVRDGLRRRTGTDHAALVAEVKGWERDA